VVVGLDAARRTGSVDGLQSTLVRPDDGEPPPRDATDPGRFSGAAAAAVPLPPAVTWFFPPPLPLPVLLVAALLLVCSVAF